LIHIIDTAGVEFISLIDYLRRINIGIEIIVEKREFIAAVRIIVQIVEIVVQRAHAIQVAGRVVEVSQIGRVI
jgi:hypothetical protein